ncbi:glycosyltransferase family 2 protein [Prosthecochloris sp. CIB 2401]|uniref:glycosyltransferase family 2 protein n=1 Tax=Prosthecochloris sp. CIB 2401 TaxID=1868325 RepID=UPI00080AAD08|nr:glycosyltransferase family 2 protein [Prosthecochloris sp. CIB 2401]ANT64905.1 N-acetylglucosaminyl-diphospho-decaprenol L-rhamnosyltransferase [Prosthecochloris sp. CIB 2401]
MVSVIIVSFNTRDILKSSIQALRKHSDGIPLEIIVVDNDSRDGSAEMVAEQFPDVVLIANSVNAGFAAANNQAFAIALHPYLVLLNPDAYIQPGSLAASVRFMERHQQCGIAGGKIVSPEGHLEPSARRFPTPLSKILTMSGVSNRFADSPLLNRHEFGGFAHDRPMEVDWVPGTYSIIRRKMLDEIGYFDERFFLYYEETDLCLRAKRSGWKVYFIPDAEVIHIGGACSKTVKDKSFDAGASQVLSFRLRSEWLYYRKNKGMLLLLASAGLEIGWHAMRYLKNTLLPSGDASAKKRETSSLLRQSIDALNATRLGTYSPPKPW